MNKRKPGMRSIDEWELDGLEIIAMRDAAKDRLHRHQKEERAQLEQAHTQDQTKANEESLTGLLKDQRKERTDLQFNHQYQNNLVEVSDDPHQTVNDFLDRSKPGRSELEVLIATQKLDQNFRDQVSAMQMRQFEELTQITALHKDKVISTDAFHMMLDAFSKEKQEVMQTLQREHSDHLKKIDNSEKPLEVASEIISRAQENTRSIDNDLTQDRNGKWFGDLHSEVPETMKNARYYNTPAGSILAMPVQDYEPPAPKVDFEIKEHFDNAINREVLEESYELDNSLNNSVSLHENSLKDHSGSITIEDDFEFDIEEAYENAQAMSEDHDLGLGR